MAVPGSTFTAAPGGSTSGNGGTLGADGWVTAPDGTQYMASQLNAPASQSTGPLPGYGSVPATGQGTTFNPYAAPSTQPPPNPALDPSLVAPFSPSGDYAAQFQQSLGAQRAALDNALATSLAQLGGRRDAAARVIATIPGSVTANLNAASERGAAMSGNADKAVKTGKKGGAVGGDANAGLYRADLQENANAGKSIEPLLQLGASANYDLGASGLQQQHMAGVTALEQQQAAFDQSMAQMQGQEAFQHNEGTLAYQRGLATTPPPETFGQKEILSGIDPKTGVPWSTEANGSTTTIDPKTGMSYYDEARIQQSQGSQDAAAVKAGYTSAQGQAKATAVGSYLVQFLHSGADTQHVIPGKQVGGKLDSSTKAWIIQQLSNDPDLGNYMSQFGYSPDAINKL